MNRRPNNSGQDEARAVALTEAIAEHGEPFALWADDMGADYAVEQAERFDEVYVGHYESEAAFAEEMWEDSGYQASLERAIPEPLRYYVEFDAEFYARDLRLGGDVTYLPAEDGGVYVYWNQ
ncbi:MAG: antirestriction protein ArdA [Micrococcales bacterium]|nr:antirestriction protein ArdA [Micrococcales bacterium]MCL2667610.1 antirestriction protein ArdA [Micrococcales bacterium]